MSSSHDPYFLLIYTFSDAFLQNRAPHRKRHIELTEELVEKGYLILGGALENPPDHAYLCFQCPDRTAIEDFVKRDPYASNGLVIKHEIRDWNVVVGTACSDPLDSANL